MDPKLPNFLLAGAPKAGTTSLASYLAQHPDVYLAPIKEPSYFSFEIRPQNFAPQWRAQIERERQPLRNWLDGPMTERRLSGLVESWEDYAKLFHAVRSEKAIGEASVIYLWAPSAPSQIAARLGQPKIILVLRNPVDRAYSQYLHGLTAGRLSCTFRELIEQALDGPKLFALHRPFLELGFYHQQIERYLQFFPRERFFIRLYEDFQADQTGTIARIFAFLGVDPTFQPNCSERARMARPPRWPGVARALKRVGVWQAARLAMPAVLAHKTRQILFRSRDELRMEARDRRWLVDYYADDVRKLETMLGRDLSQWLRP